MLGFVILFGLPAHAGTLDTAICGGGVATTLTVADDLCVSGTLSTPCGGSDDAADVYVVFSDDPLLQDVTGDGPVRLTESGGAVAVDLVWPAPLVPGVWDLVVDEDCDGVVGVGDWRQTAAFVVSGESPAVAVDLDDYAAALVAPAAETAAALTAWAATNDTIALPDLYEAAWQIEGAVPEMRIAWGGASGGDELAASDYGLLAGTSAAIAMGDVAPALRDALAVSFANAVPTGPAAAYTEMPLLQLAVVDDLPVPVPFPFVVTTTEQEERDRSLVASDLVVFSVRAHTLSIALAQHQAAVAAVDNRWITITALRARALAVDQSEVMRSVGLVLGRMLARANSSAATDMPVDPSVLIALQSRVDADGWTADESALFALHGLDPDAAKAELATADVPGADLTTWRLVLEGARVAAADSRDAHDLLVAQLDAVLAANAQYTINRSPTAVLESPILLWVGQATELDASDSLDPAGGGLTFSWDLDGDGAFGDATGPVVDAVADSTGRSPLAVRVIDADGTVDVRTAVVEAELRGGVPVFVAVGPEEVEVRVRAGGYVGFLGLAQDPEGSLLTYTFFLDGDEVSSVVATDAGEPGIWDWLPDDGAVGVHQVTVEASDGSSTALVARHTWPVWVSEGTETDGSDGADGTTDGADGATDEDSGDNGSTNPGPDPTDDGCGCSGGGGSAIGLLLVAGAFGRRRR